MAVGADGRRYVLLSPPRRGWRAFDVSASYMPSTTGEETVDRFRTTLQWSRRAIGLKVFMPLAERGRAGLADRINHQARMGDALRTKLAAACADVPVSVELCSSFEGGRTCAPERPNSVLWLFSQDRAALCAEPVDEPLR